MTREIDNSAGKPNKPTALYAYDVERYRPKQKDWILVGTRLSASAARELRFRLGGQVDHFRIQKRLREPSEGLVEDAGQGTLPGMEDSGQ